MLAVWPGSQLHGSAVMANPRWEDYEYELRDELRGNPLAWFGNGFVKEQLTAGGVTTGYLDEADVEVENPLVEKRQEESRKWVSGCRMF